MSKPGRKLPISRELAEMGESCSRTCLLGSPRKSVAMGAGTKGNRGPLTIANTAEVSSFPGAAFLELHDPSNPRMAQSGSPQARASISSALILQIGEISSKITLEVAVENLSCCFPQGLAHYQTLPASGACKASVTCRANDSLSSPPFLPFRVTRVRPGPSLAVPHP